MLQSSISTVGTTVPKRAPATVGFTGGTDDHGKVKDGVVEFPKLAGGRELVRKVMRPMKMTGIALVRKPSHPT